MFQLDPRKHCLGYVKTEIALSYIPQMISPTIQNCHEDLKTQSSMYTKKKVFLILTGNMTLPLFSSIPLYPVLEFQLIQITFTQVDQIGRENCRREYWFQIVIMFNSWYLLQTLKSPVLKSNVLDKARARLRLWSSGDKHNRQTFIRIPLVLSSLKK